MIIMFSSVLGIIYLCYGVYFSITLRSPFLFTLVGFSFIPVILISVKFFDSCRDYIDIFKKDFKLEIKMLVNQDVVYSFSNNAYEKCFVSERYYQYRCGRRSTRLKEDVANKYFLDPLKPTINEFTMFELCGYNDCIQTFGEPYDYSKSFDELFGYYMQEGFINKFKYIIKNKDRLKIGRIILE